MNPLLYLFGILLVTPTLVHYFKTPQYLTSEIIDEMYSQVDPVIYTLDVKEDTQMYTWRFSPEWFQYFNFTTDIEENVDYSGTNYTVGFPPGFTGGESLKDTEGIWMMRHANLSPAPQLIFSTLHGENREFNIIDITCYLNGNATLKFSLYSSYKSQVTVSSYKSQVTVNSYLFELPSDPDVKWHTFSVDEGPFKKFRLEMLTPKNSTDAFVMIDKIVLTKTVEGNTSTTTTTPATTTTTTTTTTTFTTTTTEHEHIASSTEVSEKTSISTEVNPSNPSKGNSILNSETIVPIIFAVLLVYNYLCL